MDDINARITLPAFDIQYSFYEYTISAKDKQGAWQPAAGGKYDPRISNTHSSWSAQNVGQLFKFSTPVIGRSPNKKDNVLVLREFRIDEDHFTNVKLSVRYLPLLTDPEAETALTVEQAD
jgi:hypothetical protein